MFIRAELKQQARELMKNRFLQMFLVCLLAGFFNGSSININIDTSTGNANIELMQIFEFSFAIAIASVIIGLSLILGIALNAFISSPVNQGLHYYFRNVTLGKEKFEDLLHSFSCNYLHNVRVLFHRDIRIFGWSMVFIIPGIIKSIEYCFVDYILNDHPDISGEEALALSSQMTDGLKMEIFILHLSFFLWHLVASFLSIITLGLSNVAVQVYQNQTEAQLYQWVLDNRNIYTEA